MKHLLILAALLPFSTFAQPLNTTNNPNQPGYVIPSQQRMQTQMLNQQQQQQSMLRQQQQTQTRLQQQNLQTQMDNSSQRIKQAQPGALNQGQQVLPNSSSGMLSGGTDSGGMTTQQHMLPQNQNGSLQQSTPPSTTAQ
ncbi:Protein of unknown function [Kosakonia arachidis]|uniref:DUF2756 family protein n=1 Tax=Kosakonia arachidis TaxID=551989 RepID=A0A1I7E0M4_9ENTR|nr:DUF2756 family protein [Kosakonia arachidis]SFU17479.1 Protein of unknown function [Kosakonia arachidis]